MADCIQLTSCELLFTEGSAPELAGSVTLPNLRSLSLDYYIYADQPRSHEHLILPALADLSFRGSSFDDIVPVLRDFGSSLQRCTLHTLNLNLETLLGFTPHLVELDLSTGSLRWDSILPLVFVPTQPPLAPALRRLTFSLSFAYSTRTKTIHPAILSVITSRCDFPSSEDTSASQPYSIPRLECARLVFTDRIACREAQCTLEDWKNRDGLEVKLAVEWYDRLRSSFFGSIKLKPSDLHSIFSEIETHDGIHPVDLQLSRLHVLMREINLTTMHTPGNELFNFRSRAEVLVEKWAPALHEHAKSCQWIVEGENALIYASRPDIRIRDGDLMKSLVFGLGESADVHKWRGRY